MRKLEFIGTVRSNKGTFAQDMIVPGRDDLLVAPADWPLQLEPGTLNIGIDRFPEGFEDGLKRLDDGKFRPELVIPQSKIAGNTLKPKRDNPTRGMAQVWRAELLIIATGQATTCWMLRRIGSSIASQIEVVSQDNLRSRLNLCDGTAVKVTVWEAESKWEPRTPDEVITGWSESARGIAADFGEEKAMGYLIGEKFLNFLEVAETDGDWRKAIPVFVAEIKALFQPSQIAVFLNTPRRLGPLGHTADDATHRILRDGLEESERLREDARNLMLLEWAKELLLES
jgi:hypothetical protein